MQDTRKIKIGLGSFDLLKGFAIILVIIGHMTSHYDITALTSQTFLGRVFGVLILLLKNGLMPMFFLIRGFAFKNIPAEKMLKRSVSGFLKPYFYAMIAISMIYPMVHCIQYGIGWGAISNTARWVLAFLFGLHDPYAEQKIIFGIEVRACWVVWFLLAMFVADNVFNLIIKGKNTKVEIVLTAVSVGAGLILSSKELTYFCIPQGLIAVGYYYVGYAMKTYNFFGWSRKVQSGFCIAMFVAAILQALFGEFDMAYNLYKNGLLEFVGTSCTGILFLILGVYLASWEGPGVDKIRQIGVYTLWILCIHSVELICFPWGKIVKMMPECQLLAFVIEISLKIIILLASCNVIRKIVQFNYRRRIMKRR